MERSHETRIIAYSRVVSLSHVIHPRIPLWPGDPPVEFSEVADLDKDGYFLRRFSMGEHTGTHMNAPIAFHRDGPGIDEHPAEALVVPAIVVDIRAQAAADPDHTLSWEDISRWENRHGQIPTDSIVLLHTGWQERWEDPVAYLNQDSSGDLHFPGFGGTTTAMLLEQREIRGVGTDAPGVDPGRDHTFATNLRVMERQGIVVESLTNLDRLPPTGVTLVIGTLRLQQGSGSPVAVTALVP